jgi:hypothetical protein
MMTDTTRMPDAEEVAIIAHRMGWLCLALRVPTRKRSSSERALLRKSGTMDARTERL